MTELRLSGTDLRCSVQTAALGEHPAGSAGFATRVLLVELPLPWPKKIDQHELLVGLDLNDKSIKVLGIRASETTELHQHRVICWERTEPFHGFERTETTVDRASLIPLLRALAESGPEAIRHPADINPATQDLLICTHGTRDRCCGQLGTKLHSDLDGVFSAAVRTWRTSHTGGHRFAPTGIHFPYGTTWSTLTPERMMAIVEQSCSTVELEAHYRGNLGVEGRPAQIAEGATFLERGWSWLDEKRSVDIKRNDATVVATVRSADHTATVRMQEEEAVPVPTCGEELEASTKATPQFRII